MHLVIAYLATMTFFLVVDLVWLGIVARDFYRAGIGHLMAENFNVTAAVVFYLMYIGGIIIFAVGPALSAGEWQKAVLWGALFGFFTYATYDFTNLATLRDWPLSVALVDTAWGTFLTASSALAGYLVASRFVTAT